MGRQRLTRAKASPRRCGTVVLDAQALSLDAERDGRVAALIAAAEQDSAPVVVSAITPLEVRRTGRVGERLKFLLARYTVAPVSDRVIEAAGALLDTSGLDGHECLVDALVVATAALSEPPVRLVTSDASHIPKLCQAAGQLDGLDEPRVITV
ncbi:type II toxin-antitoxin system VapC family toxin [Kitasatospora sp. NBC_00458]|uniref:type II toxin-antitoxin system VapC family toxin n=1 Tax=Kitasatospora sp. NBC_00458 TaxID=2903568 RepID=UPI002E1929E8